MTETQPHAYQIIATYEGSETPQLIIGQDGQTVDTAAMTLDNVLATLERAKQVILRVDQWQVQPVDALYAMKPDRTLVYLHRYLDRSHQSE